LGVKIPNESFNVNMKVALGEKVIELRGKGAIEFHS
jgi:hypothetical protein